MLFISVGMFYGILQPVVGCGRCDTAFIIPKVINSRLV
jgi:hypothetical protein